MKFENMFKPIQIGPMTVKNRFVVPPMGNNFANADGCWSDQSVAYYAERAKGQFGLVTIEATVVHKGAKGGPRKPCLYDEKQHRKPEEDYGCLSCKRRQSFHPAAECRAGRKCKECRRANPGGNSHPIYGRKRHTGRSAYRAGI